MRSWKRTGGQQRDAWFRRAFLAIAQHHTSVKTFYVHADEKWNALSRIKCLSTMNCALNNDSCTHLRGFSAVVHIHCSWDEPCKLQIRLRASFQLQDKNYGTCPFPSPAGAPRGFNADTFQSLPIRTVRPITPSFLMKPFVLTLWAVECAGFSIPAGTDR